MNPFRALLVLASVPALATAQTGGSPDVAGGLPGAPEVVVRGIRAGVSRLYEGQPRQGDPIPLRLTLANDGPDTAGAVVVEGSQGTGATSYPVELPRGSRKSLVVVLPGGYYGEGLRVRTDRAELTLSVPLSNTDARTSALAIGDGSGGFGFLQLGKTKSKSEGYESTRQTVTVLYARPEDALTNEADYGRTAVVMLLPGAERMPARAVEALRRYALRGGHVLLFGGASAPYLTDPRFRVMLPFAGLTPGEVSVGGSRVSIQRPTAIPAAERVPAGGVPTLRRAFGVGRVSYFAANPLEGGLAQAANRTAIVERALDLTRSTEMAARPWNLGPAITEGGANPGSVVYPGRYRYGGSYATPYSTTYGGSGGYGAEGTPGDPFSLPIPPTGQIALLLGVYFLVVLPVNFLILRGFKRLEWAWFTAPAIAVVFAGVLFRNAGALYKTALSKATQTVVFARSGSGEGVALGHASIFFPSAATGPIPIPNALLVDADLYGSGNEYGYRDTSRTRALDVVRADAPSVPDYRSSSLEFRDLDYHQVFDLGKGIRIVGSKLSGRKVFTVINGSPYTLTEVRAKQGSQGNERTDGTDEPIPPGGSAVLEKSAPDSFSSVPTTLYRYAPLLMATLRDADAGPTLGKTVPMRTYTKVLVSGEVAP